MERSKSPIVDVLRRIAGFPEQCAERWWNGVAVFSYRHDFGLLWGIDDTGVVDLTPPPARGVGRFIDQLIDHSDSLSGEDRWLTAVIVCDGVPPADTTAHRLVTPCDWAMLVAGAIYGRLPGLRATLPEAVMAIRLEVWMVDLLRDGAHDEFPSLRKLQEFSWIRRFDWSALRPLVDQLPKRYASPRTTHAESDDRGREQIESACHLWAGNVHRHEDRHSVANLVAPIVLAEELGASRFIEMSKPERALMSALLAIAPASEVRETDPRRRLLEPSGGPRGRARFLLVDDRFEQGYHHVLGTALFGEDYDPSTAATSPWRYSLRGSSLECHGTIDRLLEQIATFGAIGDWESPRRLLADRCDVLLLDLRFWEQRDTESRRSEMEKVCRAARDCGFEALAGDDREDDRDDSEKGHRAPRAALKAARKVARNAVGAREEGDGAFEPEAAGLALLPLMVSFIDPTLPVVVFSSTRQRIVSDMLRDRRNVITDFAKPAPNVIGSREGGFLQSADALKAAIRKALDLHERRMVWERLCALTASESAEDFGWRGRYGSGVYAKLPDFDKHELAGVVERFTLGEITAYESLYRPWSFLDNWLRRGDPPRDAELWISPTGRGRLARAVREIGRDMYGSLDRHRFEDDGAQRVAVLLFLFLLDFVAGIRRPTDWAPGRPKPTEMRDWTAVRHVLGEYGRPENGETFLSTETEAEVRRLCYEGG